MSLRSKCNKIKYTTGYAVQNGGTTLHMIENNNIIKVISLKWSFYVCKSIQ